MAYSDRITSIIKNLDGLTFECSLDGKCISAWFSENNPLSLSSNKVIGVDIRLLFGEAATEAIDDLVSSAVKFSGTRKILEVMLDTPAGVKTFRFSAKIVEEINDDRYLLVHVGETSNERESRLQQLNGAGGIGTWEWNLLSGHVQFDLVWGAILGLSEAELKPSFEFFENLVHLDDMPLVKTAIDDYLNGSSETYEVTFRMRHVYGHWVWILSKGKIAKRNQTGEPVLIIGTHTDVTELKEAARESELFYRLSKEMNLGLYMFQLEVWDDPKKLRLVWANPQAQKFTDIDPRSVVGKYFEEAFPGTDIYLEFVRSIREKVSVGFDRFAYVLPTRKSEDYFNVRCFPLEKDYVVVLFENITESVTRDRVLEKQKEIAVSASRLAALGEMSGGIAHEVNNPLAIIQGHARQMRKRIASGKIGMEEIAQILQLIEETSDRIAKIIRGLRKFAREGSADPLIAKNVGALIEDTLSFCSERFKNNRISIVVREIDPKLEILCREVEIGQVLINLLNNAFDALKEFDTAEKVVEISAAREGDFVELKISDNGPGIPEKIRESVMQPFFTTKEVGKGTGLGLSISSGIVQRNNGTLTLDETYERGACFLIRIPGKA